MSIIKVDYGEISEGNKGANGIIDNPSANTEYEIDTGLSEIKTFTIMANDQATYGSITCYNADWSTTKVTRSGGNSKTVEENIPNSNSGYYISLVSINGGKVTIKSPDQSSFFGGKFLWSAT